MDKNLDRSTPLSILGGGDRSGLEPGTGGFNMHYQCIRKDQQYALIVPLLYPTCSGSSLPSSGSLSDPPELPEIQMDKWYIIRVAT
jgi:hypothetical protein